MEPYRRAFTFLHAGTRDWPGGGMVSARLEVTGWFGAVASTHWLASQTGMGVLEKGGNAFDAAVAAGLAMQVAQPHLNGPAGDVAILVHDGRSGEVVSVCGQGPIPAAASIAGIRALGLDLVPGTGLLPAVVPGAFDAWMLLLRERGSIGLEEVLAPAILYAERGVPVDARLHETLTAAAPIFRKHWPASARQYLVDGGSAPPPGGLFRNPTLAATWRRLLAEARAAAGGDRDGQIEAARAIWAEGFIAGAIDRFCRSARVMDVSGGVHGSFLRGEDLAAWRAAFEPALSLRFAGHRIFKCGAWSQGPALLQALALLDAPRLAALEPGSAGWVHLLTEALKLALADRDAHYGAGASAARIDRLLSEDYARARRGLIGEAASHAFRPGGLEPGDWQPDFAAAGRRQRAAGLLAAYGGGEPTVAAPEPDPEAREMAAHAARAVGDTSYLAVVDRAGNAVSATPSGGWLQSSPVIPDLGFPLGTRAQMTWLDPAAPSAFAPGRRPRTTLTPTIARGDDGRVLAVGTPGGDQQEQWQLAFLVRHLVHGQSLQAAMDAPGFHTNHVVNSFYPRGAAAGALVAEGRLGAGVLDELRGRGHVVTVAGDWVEGRLCAVAAGPDGSRRAAVTPRGGQGLAVGR